MTARTDVSRSLPDRQHLGAQLRHARDSIGLTQRQVAAMTGIRQSSVSYVETAGRDVLLSSAVDLASACGRVVALAGEHHLPLLDLTADELRAVLAAARCWADTLTADHEAGGYGYGPSPHLRSALDKLTTTEENAHA